MVSSGGLEPPTSSVSEKRSYRLSHDDRVEGVGVNAIAFNHLRCGRHVIREVHPMSMPSSVELAWTAGIIDGDGSITLTRRSKRPFRSPVVAVDSTDVEILHELSRLFGGHTVTKKKARQHHRQAWAWRLVGSENIIAFLSQVLPYMRCKVKADRARMLVEEYKLVTPRNGFIRRS